jgi:hypothetical protein
MKFLRNLLARITGNYRTTDSIFIREGVITRKTIINGKKAVETRQMTDKDFFAFNDHFKQMNNIHERMMKQFEEGK